jgi:hypothetical protein
MMTSTCTHVQALRSAQTLTADSGAIVNAVGRETGTLVSTLMSVKQVSIHAIQMQRAQIPTAHILAVVSMATQGTEPRALTQTNAQLMAGPSAQTTANVSTQ